MPHRQEGYLVQSGPFGIIERETFTCGHCPRVTVITPGCFPEEMGGLCYMCNKLVCKHCADGPCVPYEKKLERLEASARFLRDVDPKDIGTTTETTPPNLTG